MLEPLGADVSGSQFLQPDGTFPNHIPNPENKAAMEAAVQAVKHSGGQSNTNFGQVDILVDDEQTSLQLAVMVCIRCRPPMPWFLQMSTTLVTESEQHRCSLLWCIVCCHTRLC